MENCVWSKSDESVKKLRKGQKVEDPKKKSMLIF